MLTEIYIEALLVNEKWADQVWEAWDKGVIDDQVAGFLWKLIAVNPRQPDDFLLSLRPPSSRPESAIRAFS